MNLMSWVDSMTFEATTSSRFSERVVDAIGSASAPLSFGKMSGHNFSPVVRLTNSEPVMPGMMMIGGLPVCLATTGAGKMAGKFGLLALSKQALVAISVISKRSGAAGRESFLHRRCAAEPEGAQRDCRKALFHLLFSAKSTRSPRLWGGLNIPFRDSSLLFKAFVERLFAESLAGRRSA